MLWRLWCFVCGCPAGALAALAWRGSEIAPRDALGAALAGGVLLVLAASLVARLGASGRALAAAAGVGLAALPALGAAFLGLAPGARISLALVLAALVVALAATRRSATARPAAWAAGSLLAGTLGFFALAFGAAAIGSVPPPLSEGTSSMIFDLDARVATRPLPRCNARPLAVDVLLGRGAHPRLSRDGAALWFDAPGPDGRRQVHRLLLEKEILHCWTCGEPGENRRPAPTETGRAVIFDTDRWKTFGAPANTELHQMSAAGDEPRRSSRRLTYHAGLDDHATPSPGGVSVVWSRQVEGRVEVVSAAYMTGHGALLLADPRPIAASGAPFAAPLAWSPDARGLAVGRGNPLGPLRAEALDPATGRILDLGRDAAGPASVAWSSDGGRVAVVLARPAGLTARLPGAVGFLLRPLAAALGEPAPRLREGELRTGDAGGELTAVELGAAATWGSPTGVAMEPDGTRIVLGQRRDGSDGVEERLLRVTLDCNI